MIRAFNDVAEAVAADTPLNDLLHLVARRICELCEIRRCSIYLRDEETGLFRGQIGHQHGKNIDAAVQRLVAGVVADRFTHEITETKKPVLVRDTLHDPRPIRATMREWNVRAMVGVPMLASNEVVGICYLDNEDEPHPFTSTQVEIAATFANLAAIAIVQAQMAEKRRIALETVARQNELLQRARQIDDQLTRLVLDDANLATVASVVGELTGNPCVIYDTAYNTLAAYLPPQEESIRKTLFDDGLAADSAVEEALARLSGRQSGLVGPFQSLGLNHRFLVAPIVVRNDQWGFLVVVEQTGRFGPLDPVVAARASTIIALELAAARRAASARGEALDSLALDLVRGVHDEAKLEQRATFLGIRLTVPHFVALIAAVGAEADLTPTPKAVLEKFREIDPRVQVLTTAVAEGVVTILQATADEPSARAAEQAKQLVSQVCDGLSATNRLVGGVSTICRRPSEIPRAYAEAVQVVHLVETFGAAEQSPVLAIDDLGVGRLFLASANREEADRYVADTLGALLDPSDSRMVDLLTTLRCFLDTSCSIRRTAEELDVHENTVRYRFSRVKELTGLDVMAQSNDQLAVQLALLVLRLEGRWSAEA
jgi:sugar diacid utilization regulator